MSVWIHMYACEGQELTPDVFLDQSLPYFWDKFSHLTRSYHFVLACSSYELEDSTCLNLPRSEITDMLLHKPFYVGAAILNLGPPVCFPSIQQQNHLISSIFKHLRLVPFIYC